MKLKKKNRMKSNSFSFGTFCNLLLCVIEILSLHYNKNLILLKSFLHSAYKLGTNVLKDGIC